MRLRQTGDTRRTLFCKGIAVDIQMQWASANGSDAGVNESTSAGSLGKTKGRMKRLILFLLRAVPAHAGTVGICDEEW